LRKVKSPYQRYNKKPFRYSDHFNRLHKAIVDRSNNVEELRLEHNKYLRDILGWKPSPEALRGMKPLQRSFWTKYEYPEENLIAA
jgi:hypothetical protein